MKTEDYTKHKDCSPEETVFRIRRILQEAELYPVLTWTEDEFDGVCSNRVFLDPVMGLGTNGKGTGRRYAEASAFAELIERIQNRILHIKAFGPEESPYPISDRYPDEKDMRLEELVAQKDAFLEGLFRCLGFQTAMEKKLYLQKAAEEFYSKTDGTIPVIPFADPTGDRAVWLPAAVLVSFCGSNGMSAGNTMEEALVQGFSEILERYSQARILRLRRS